MIATFLKHYYYAYETSLKQLRNASCNGYEIFTVTLAKCYGKSYEIFTETLTVTLLKLCYRNVTVTRTYGSVTNYGEFETLRKFRLCISISSNSETKHFVKGVTNMLHNSYEW